MEDIKILILDGCTLPEAERHLENGSVVFREADLKEHFETYAKEWELDEDEKEKYKKMIECGEPLTDWGVVDTEKERYFIMYCL